MNTLTGDSSGRKAGFLGGYTDGRAEIDALDPHADRYYRQAHNDERHILNIVQAGRIQVTKLTVVEDTGECRGGTYVEHTDATTQFIEAKFGLGENAAVTLRTGGAAIVIGRKASNAMDVSSRPTTSVWISAGPWRASEGSPVRTAVSRGGVAVACVAPSS
ncbi:hypothetical protein [Subtercola frigoramans]|uniref:Uncharacterized protein n=1 Tax=Subtercola frigoramans TaxID=120298 RepID=A0ABS2L0I4_9MICO|nr:hypothetical protein [Subtercola frigoramans]MBM7470554.1 hypothetical protein [Subtercola frigoramans]